MISLLIECMKTFFPNHYVLYKEARLRLELVDNLVQTIFRQSPFHAMSINDGPRANAEDHRDSHNLIWGLCALGVFGNFNHKTHGQLILREARLVIELAPGDIFIFPSGGITHCNPPFENNDELANEVFNGKPITRYSLVQYVAGGNLRWIWQGHRIAPKYKNELGFLVDSDKERLGTERWIKGWQLFPTEQQYFRAKDTGVIDVDKVILSDLITDLLNRAECK